MDLLTKILINKYKNQSGGGPTPTGEIEITENGTYDVTSYASANVNIPSSSDINLFIQNDQPEGYNGIWIKSDNLSQNNIIEVNDRNSLMPSKINIVKGKNYSTKIYTPAETGGLTYSFNNVMLTNSENEVDYDTKIYYGNSEEWIDITPTVIPYRQLQYIESKGTGYFLTGYGANLTDYTIEVEASFPSADGFIYGSMVSYHSYGLGGLYYDNGTLKYFYGENYSASIGSYSTNTRYVVNSVFSSTKIVTTFNGTVKTTTRNASATNSNIYLFRRGSDSQFGGKNKLYYCKIFNSEGATVRDYVPVKDDDNKIALYDAFNQTLLYPSSQNDFIAGPEV